MKSQRKATRLHYRVGKGVMLFVGILMSLLTTDGIARQDPDSKKVLVLYWYNKDYSWNVSFDQSFQDALRSDRSFNFEYYAEYLETDRFPERNQSPALHDYLRRKYSGRRIDVLVASSDSSLDFLLRYRKDLFPQSPIIFVATQRPGSEERAAQSLTGIINVSTYKDTLDLALRLHPDTQKVFLISGTVQHDKRLETLLPETERPESHDAVGG